MPSIHSLPDELLLRILWYIPREGLQTFSEISLRLNGISNRVLREYKKNRYRVVKLKYEQDYHDLCIRALSTDVSLYVEEVIINPDDSRDEVYHNLKFNAIEDEMSLYQSAMEQCVYIPDSDIPGLIERLRSKNATMIFVILLLNLPNLRTLSINQFGVEEALDYLLDIIKQVVMSPPCDSSPFNKLQAVNLIPLLNDVEAFMALPSVLIIFVQGSCDYVSDGELFQRDPTLPLSRIHEINFYDFVNSESCITSLISGVDGHCIRVNEGTEDPIDHRWWPQVSFIRYLYFHYLTALLKKAWTFGDLSDALEHELGKRYWATPGPYLRGRYLKAFVTEVGHVFEPVVKGCAIEEAKPEEVGKPSDPVGFGVAANSVVTDCGTIEDEEEDGDESDEEDFEGFDEEDFQGFGP